MAYAFKQRSGVARQVRTIAAEQVEKALAAAETGNADFDGTVHALRRRCKKLRGLLRLIQPRFEAFSNENAALRDAADLLGGARDARVMVQTLDGLIGEETGQVVAARASAARQYIVDRVEQMGGGDERNATLDQFASIFGELAGRIKRWRLEGGGFALVGDGLQGIYRQFCKDAAKAEKQDSAEVMHDWRKQAKYHLYHVNLLIEAAPDILTARAKTLERLGDLLGDHHNLAVLQDTLADHFEPSPDTEAIGNAIAGRQADLAHSAIALGRQLAAEKPAALRQRFAGYWDLLPKEN